MGAAIAPNFANLYMGFWEMKFIHNDANPFRPFISDWRRYIDDIFLLWTGTKSQLEEFVQYINQANANLTFKCEFDQEINFLDLHIYKNVEKLETTLFSKPTDRNTILFAKSQHPRHMITNIPVGQFLRVRRNCSTNAEFQSKSTGLYNKFKERGYPDQILTTAFERAQSTERNSLLCKNTRKPDNFSDGTIFFSMEYSHLSTQIKNIIYGHWSILNSDPGLRQSISQTPPKIFFKRAKNLKDTLVQSLCPKPQTLNWMPTPPSGNFKCGHCVHCANTTNTKTFSHPRSGQQIKINGFINCNVTGVVYMLICVCGMAYVGQTKRALKVRIAEHKAAIRNNNLDYSIAKHYVLAGHGSSPHALRFVGIERVRTSERGGDLIQLLLKREAYWVLRLQTLTPSGLNEGLNYCPLI